MPKLVHLFLFLQCFLPFPITLPSWAHCRPSLVSQPTGLELILPKRITKLPSLKSPLCSDLTTISITTNWIPVRLEWQVHSVRINSVKSLTPPFSICSVFFRWHRNISFSVERHRSNNWTTNENLVSVKKVV